MAEEAISLVEKRQSQLPPPPSGSTRRARLQGRSSPRQVVEEDGTVEIVPEEGPVRTLAIAGSLSLGICLRASLGGTAIAVMSVANAIGVRAALDDLAPSVVVIDGSDLPSELSAEDIVRELAKAPPATLRVVWGTENDEAGPLIRAFAKSGQAFVPVDRAHGPEPLLDIFRARRGISLG